jgi:hypothetical protein
MINHPDILADIAHQHRAEMIAAADEFRRTKQLRRPRKPRRTLRRAVIRAVAPGRSGPSQHSHPAELQAPARQDVNAFAHVQEPQVVGLVLGAKVEADQMPTARLPALARRR